MSKRQRAKSRNARDRIVAASASLFHSKGYTATGLDEILGVAEATKGSFYHHFGSKKEIALAVIKEVISEQFTRRMITPVVEAHRPLAAIRDVIRSLRTQTASEDLLTGCPINNLASELALQDPKLQKVLSTLLERWQTCWAKALRNESALKKRTGFKDPRALSMYLVAAIEGAQAMAKAQQSRAPLDAVLKHLEATVTS
jgi:TetR/AcrR family transcriptional repressor of nem operon